MAVLLTPPRLQFFDNSGNPLAGGKVYTYEAGTTTPKDTYTNQGGGTPNANPVILDSAGRASIWLSGSYKIVVKDSSDNTITTDDNITAFQTGSGSTFVDNAFTIQNSSDATKQIQFSLSSLTTGSTNTVTIPDGNFTIAKASQIIPTRQYLTSGTSATYTTPANCRKIVVRMVGAGGGGAGSGSSPGAAGAGGNTSFNSIVANGGSAGGAGSPGAGGAGGTGGSGSADLRVVGGSGAPGASPAANVSGGSGGNSFWGGGGRGGAVAAGGAAATNSGGGGGGAGIGSGGTNGGSGGGGAGEYAEFSISSPSASYTYSVGTAGTAGTAGTGSNPFAGGAGGSGLIIVDEYY